MDPSNLSSNWKRLQQTLSKDADRQPRRDKQDTSDQRRPSAGRLASKRGLENQISGNSAPAAKKRKLSPAFKSWSHGKMSAHGTSTSQNGHIDRHAAVVDKALATSASPAAAGIAQKSGESTATTRKYIAIDCEMVGTDQVTPFSILAHNRDAMQNDPPEYSILARVSLVNFVGETVYDAYVLPPPGVRVSNYRTEWSGITPSHLDNQNPLTKPIPFETAQKEVADLTQGLVLVGHALQNDLDVLGLVHPKRDVRDTSRYPKYRDITAPVGRNGKLGKSRTPSLKRLANEILGLSIQEGKGHSSVEDAWTAMLLYKREKNGFESEVARLYGRPAALKAARPVKASLRVLNSGGTVELDSAGAMAMQARDEAGETDDVTDSDAVSNVGEIKPRPKAAKKKKKKKKSRTKR